MKLFSPKVLLLDLGGVLFDVDYQATINAFKSLGFPDFDALYSKARQGNLFDFFEKGHLEEMQFYEAFSQMQPGISKDRIRDAWNAMLIGIPPHRLVFLEQLAARYPLFLLSNTNEIHVDELTKRNLTDHGYDPLEKFFSGIYFSCRIGMRKPDQEVFEYVLQNEAMLREDVLFIDDSPQHVEGAKQCGIPAFLLNVENNMRLEYVLPEIISL